MKRLTVLFLAFVMVLMSVPAISVSADNYLNLSYEIRDGEAIITGWQPKGDTLDIPYIIDGYPVTTIGNGAFSGSDFENMILPPSLEKIERNAFWNCYKLKEVYIPENVKEIGEEAFAACYSLKKISVDEQNAHYYIDSNCLIERSSGTLLVGFGKAKIPEDGSVRIIADDALGASNIEKAYISKYITQINGAPFSDCADLEKIVVEEGNPVYHSSGNCLIETATKTLIAGSEDSVIPNDGSVTKIAQHAFMGIQIDYLRIPDCITEIEVNAFHGTSLKKIEIPANTVLDSKVFAYCYELKDIYFEVDSQPAEWEDDWLGDNCEAEIHWGAKLSAEDTVKDSNDDDDDDSKRSSESSASGVIWIIVAAIVAVIILITAAVVLVIVLTKKKK